VIPEGYGAGIVMLWDRGTWEPEAEDVDASLKKGDLKFRLDGYKLKGSWVLVRTRGYSASRSGGRSGDSGRSWLLIKHRDDWSGPIDITTFAPLSVKTPDADLADILAADNPAIWRGNPPTKGGDTGQMFQRIIERALEIQGENRRSAAAPAQAAPKRATAAKSTKTAKTKK
jgi:bifunctional non-homologous end joining protein LigD